VAAGGSDLLRGNRAVGSGRLWWHQQQYAWNDRSSGAGSDRQHLRDRHLQRRAACGSDDHRVVDEHECRAGDDNHRCQRQLQLLGNSHPGQCAARAALLRDEERIWLCAFRGQRRDGNPCRSHRPVHRHAADGNLLQRDRLCGEGKRFRYRSQLHRLHRDDAAGKPRRHRPADELCGRGRWRLAEGCGVACAAVLG